MPRVNIAVPMTVPTIQRTSLVSRFAICVESRVSRLANLGTHLGETGPELVGGDVVAVLEAVVDRLGDDLGLVAVDAKAASCWATASVSSIETACLSFNQTLASHRPRNSSQPRSRSSLRPSMTGSRCGRATSQPMRSAHRSNSCIGHLGNRGRGGVTTVTVALIVPPPPESSPLTCTGRRG